jgi:hypothetical protein
MKPSAIIGLVFAPALLACTMLACATAGGSGGELDPSIKHVVYGSAELGADATPTTPVTWYDVSAPTEVTWQLLPVAFSRLGLSITKYDSTTHLIEGERLGSAADFGGRPLGSLLNCGISGRAVDIHVRAALKGSATATASSVASVVKASVPDSSAAGQSTPCAASAAMTDRVAAAVLDAVAEMETGK